jgi:formylmethanofuran dehydrogenase subunit C
MKNLDMSMNGNTLTIKINIKEEFGESKSGKSVVIATSGGNIPVPGNPDIKLGLNCYKSKS